MPSINYISKRRGCESPRKKKKIINKLFEVKYRLAMNTGGIDDDLKNFSFFFKFGS